MLDCFLDYRYFDLFEDRSPHGHSLSNACYLRKLLMTHLHVPLNVTVSESMFNAYSVSGEKQETRNLAPARQKRANPSRQTMSQLEGSAASYDPEGASDSELENESGTAAKRVCLQAVGETSSAPPSGKEIVSEPCPAAEANRPSSQAAAPGHACTDAQDTTPSDQSKDKEKKAPKPKQACATVSSSSTLGDTAPSGDLMGSENEEGNESDLDEDHPSSSNLQGEADVAEFAADEGNDGGNSRGKGGEGSDDIMPGLDEECVRMGAFHCLSSLVASSQVCIARLV